MTGSQQLRLFGVEHTAYQWVSAGGGTLAGVFHVFLRPQVPGAPDECSLTFHTPLLCLAGFQFVSGGSCSRWANALDTCFLGAWRAAGCNMLSAFLWDGNGQPSELELWITHSKENRSREIHPKSLLKMKRGFRSRENRTVILMQWNSQDKLCTLSSVNSELSVCSSRQRLWASDFTLVAWK